MLKSSTVNLSREEFERNKLVEEIRDEYERKISAIVFCLQEKSEENIDLNAKIKSLAEQQKKAEDNFNKVVEGLHEITSHKDEELLKERKKTQELDRRAQAMSELFNEMADDNIKLKDILEDTRNRMIENQKNFNKEVSLAVKKAKEQMAAQSGGAKILSGLSKLIPNNNNNNAQSPVGSPTKRDSLSVPNGNGNGASSPPLLSQQNSSSNLLSTEQIISNSMEEIQKMEELIGLDIILKNDDKWTTKVREANIKMITKSLLNQLLDRVECDQNKSQETIEKLRNAVSDLENRTDELTREIEIESEKSKNSDAALFKEKQRGDSFRDSAVEYEKKIKDLETRMYDNLNKETQRRTDAEYNAKRLKKKVEELEFLLEEMKNDSDSEEEEDSDNDSDCSSDSSELSDDSDEDEKQKQKLKLEKQQQKQQQEKERLEQERIEKERLDKLEKEKQEKERLEKLKLENERLEKEKKRKRETRKRTFR